MKRNIFLILIILILGLGFCFFFVFKERQKPDSSNKFMDQTKQILSEPKIFSESNGGEISLVTLFDNYQADERLQTGWGFSCLVKMGLNESVDESIRLLFDTGADGETLLDNMEKMKIDPKEIDIVVLSHIHADHIGGLEKFLEKREGGEVFIPASFPASIRKQIESLGANFRNIKEATRISEDIYSTGEMGTMIKEQSLVLKGEQGLIIITGCAHPGVVNIIKKAKKMFPGKTVSLVLGGFHLTGVSDSELKEIVSDFRELEVKKAAPCHCSGDRARELFEKEYQKDFIENGVGKIINID